MSLHDYVLANQSGANFRADLNNLSAAIASHNSGATDPAGTFSTAYMLWADTANDLMKQRNAANSAWISMWKLSLGMPAFPSVTTKGDSLWASAAGVLARLGVGTDGFKVRANSGATPGVDWIRSAPNMQVFTASGTYTPTTGMTACLVIGVGGGGGGGGGSVPGTASTYGVGWGGYAGSLAISMFTASQVGASKTVTIGGGGTGGTSNSGAAGGNTSLGTLLVADGGGGGSTTTSGAPYNAPTSMPSAPSGTGDFLVSIGRPGSILLTDYGQGLSAAGANSFFGAGGMEGKHNATGVNAVGRGAGGSGSISVNGGVANKGGDGSGGALLVIEFF